LHHADASSQIISWIFSINQISFAHGKLRAPSLALDWQINRLIEVEARVSYHAGRWYEHVASAFPLVHQLSGGAGLWSFSSIAVKYSGYDG
jgi:hypothetical protein